MGCAEHVTSRRRFFARTLAVLTSCRLTWVFAYAGRGISPLKSDIEVLGVLRGRLVIGFHPRLEVGRAVGGRLVLNVTDILPEETVPSAAMWNERFMRQKPIARRPRLQEGRRMIRGLQDSGWS
eukprot:g7394.t1